VTDDIRLLFPIWEKYNSMIHKDLLDYIADDALTGKSFSEIGKGIGNNRLSEYMKKKVFYYSLINSLKGIFEENKITGEKFEIKASFSPMDSEKGYNEMLQSIDQYYSEIFIEFIKENDKMISDSLSLVPPPKLISMDHTFNVQKRTRTYNDNVGFYEKEKKDTLFTMMREDGMIYNLADCEGTGAPGDFGYEKPLISLKSDIEVYNIKD
jgi:hypothetical protein